MEAHLLEVTVLAERLLPSDQRSAQSFLPTLSDLCSECGWQPGQIELVCVTTGPGSFTGLRIGVTAAKALAYAVGAKLAGVHTLVALAASVPQPAGRVWTILDAQRQELFVSYFDGNAITQNPETRIVSSDKWLAELKPRTWSLDHRSAICVVACHRVLLSLTKAFGNHKHGSLGDLDTSCFAAGKRLTQCNWSRITFARAPLRKKPTQ